MATSALKASKTPAIIVAEIRMMSSNFRGAHFLVEGDDDSKFWKSRVSKTRTSIVICEGKQNLLGARNLINNDELSHVTGVYDADFDRMLGNTQCHNMLAATDENDLEVTLAASEALHTLLHEYADEKLINDFENAEGTTVAAHLDRLSCEFGRLRLLSLVRNHQVDFDDLSPYRFVSCDDWSLDLVGLRSEYAKLAGVSVETVSTELEAHTPTVNMWGLSQGHDTVRILAQGLKKRIGRRQISEQDITRVLRIAYSKEMLQKSKMYGSLKAIERLFPVPIFD